MLIMALAGQAAEASTLASSVSAYLSDLDARVEVRTVSELSPAFTDQVARARGIAGKEPDVLAVIWVERTADELFIFVSDRASEKVLVQTLPRGPDGWDASCDAIATLVRSALSPWLAEEAPAAEPPPASGAAPQPAAPAPPAAAEPSPTAESPLSLALIISAAYAPCALDPERGVVSHAAAIGLGLAVGRHFEAGVRGLIAGSTELDVAGEDIRLSRIPFGVSATGLLPLGPVELGLDVAFLVDTVRILGIARSTAPDDTDDTRFGLGAALVLRGRVLDWLALWMRVGTDFFFFDTNYVWNGEERLTYAAFQPGGAAGVAFLLPLRHESR